jgi:hypothetical protein
MTCAVCQQKFKNHEIKKILTNKSIWEFFEHLKKRQIHLSYSPIYRYSSNTAKICDLCFMLVVSEIELIEL